MADAMTTVPLASRQSTVGQTGPYNHIATVAVTAQIPFLSLFPSFFYPSGLVPTALLDGSHDFWQDWRGTPILRLSFRFLVGMSSDDFFVPIPPSQLGGAIVRPFRIPLVDSLTICRQSMCLRCCRRLGSYLWHCVLSGLACNTIIGKRPQSLRNTFSSIHNLDSMRRASWRP